MNMLILGSQPRSISALARRLRAMGYLAITMVTSPKEAPQRAASEKIDLVIIDVRSAIATQFLPIAQQLIQEQNLAVICTIARGDQQAAVLAEAAGIRWRLVRPFSDRELACTIHAAQELRAVEQRLVEVHSMISIGVAASGIAHEFNNILTSIAGNTELAMLDIAPDTDTVISMQQIQAGVRRGTLLTRQLLLLAGRVRANTPVFEIGTLLQEMEPLFMVAAGKRVTLTLRPSSVPTLFAGDAGRMRMMLVTLVVDLAQSSGDGEIVIACWPIDATAQICIEFRSTIPVDRLLQSYEVVQLGIATARLFVAAYGGWVMVEDTRDTHAIRLFLPSTEIM